MRVKTVSASYGRKFNLGDYNSASFEVSLWADIDYVENRDDAGNLIASAQTENEHDVVNELFSQAKDYVRVQAMPVLRPQLKAIEQQLENVQMSQEQLRGILASLIANGQVEITLAQPEGAKQEAVKGGKK